MKITELMTLKHYKCSVAGLIILAVGIQSAIAQQAPPVATPGTQPAAPAIQQPAPGAAPGKPVQQPPPPREAPEAEHIHATSVARNGNARDGLVLLEKLLRKYPDDLSVRRDYCVVLNWDQRYAKSVEIFNTLPPDQPGYVVLAAAGSYRRLQKYREALDLYKTGAQNFPENINFKAGEILTLTDARQPKEALSEADRLLSTQKDSIPILLAAGYASMAMRNPTAALPYYDQVLLIDPKNHEAAQQQQAATEQLRANHQKSNHHRKKSQK